MLDAFYPMTLENSEFAATLIDSHIMIYQKGNERIVKSNRKSNTQDAANTKNTGSSNAKHMQPHTRINSLR